jgi:hypothetical protein
MVDRPRQRLTSSIDAARLDIAGGYRSRDGRHSRALRAADRHREPIAAGARLASIDNFA